MAKNTLPPLALLLSDNRGIYIPRDFVTEYDLSRWEGIDPDDISACEDPDNEWYWEAWHNITSNATFTENGHVWRLWQDGDLWAYCAELMSAQEYRDFFGECSECGRRNCDLEHAKANHREEE